MSALHVWRCVRCRALVFPDRELCPHCDGDSFLEESVDAGIATEITEHRGTRIACVEVDGARIIVRAGEGVAAGPVRLDTDGRAPVAVTR